MGSVQRRRRGALALCTTFVLWTFVAVGPVGLPDAAADPSALSATYLALQPVASGLDQPVAIGFRPGDARAYVAEQTGRLVLIGANGVVSPTPVLTLTPGTGPERGLLGFVFSSDGTKLYVDYTDTIGTIQIVEYTMAGDVANVASARSILSIPHPVGIHNGGQILFGPDGMLYISVGDGGGPNDQPGNAQNLNTLLGKILRIDPTPSGGLEYTIPADNPFAGQANTRGEVFMYGLRNPWRFTFDRATGDLWIGDVGQGQYEEVDYAPAGQKGTNWGWNQREGFHEFKGPQPPDGQDPLLERSHDEGYCAMISGYVYRGAEIPGLQGAYLYGDLCAGRIVGVNHTGSSVTEQHDVGVDIGNLVAFGEDSAGELYVAKYGGTIYKLIVATPSMTIGDATIVEGDSGTSTISVPVTLSAPSTMPVSAHWATVDGTAKAPADLTAGSGTVQFAPGQTTAFVTVPVVGDEIAEGAEAFSVKLTAPVGASLADDKATANVLDNDGPVSIEVNDAVVVEGNSGSTNATFAVSLSRPVPSGAPVKVTVSTANGTAVSTSDYTALAATVLTFAPGEQSKTVSIAVHGDTTVEKSETFNLMAKTPVGAVLANPSGLATIVNDDGAPTAPPKPSVSIRDTTIVEGDASTTLASVQLSLSAPSAVPVSVHWATASNTAKAPSDFTAGSGTATFPVGETSTTVSVPVVGDAVLEMTEKLTVKLSSPNGATLADTAGVINVLDNDAPISASITDATVVEGNSGTATANFIVSLSRPVPAGGSNVSVAVSSSDYSAKAPDDYTPFGTVLTFTVGQQTKSVSLTVIGDTLVEKNEMVKLNLKSPVGTQLADALAIATIINDD